MFFFEVSELGDEQIEVGIRNLRRIKLVIETEVSCDLLTQLGNSVCRGIVFCWVSCHTAMLSVRCVATFESVFGPSSRELWIFRVVWLVLPFVCGPLFAAALEDTAELFERGAAILLWISWAALLIALMVPRTETLTAIRIVPFAGAAAAIWAALDARNDANATTVAVGLVATGVAAAMSLRPPVTDAFADGSSYGDERRFLLSTPGPLLLGPLALVWVAIVVGAATGPLLLLAERWIIGALTLIAGWALVWFAVPIMHRLSNRWLVFVPAGMVVHDKTALREPQLFRVEDIELLGPAPLDSEEQDLTLDALGLALRVSLKEESKIIRNARGQSIDLTEITGFLVSPNRPGAVVEEARLRGYPIG